MSRRWLVCVSVVAHLCILVGVFASGVWRLERLDGTRGKVSLTQPLAMPAPAPAGARAPRAPEIRPKLHREIAKGPHQPPVTRIEPTPPDRTGGDGATGTGTGSGDPTATGACTENCGDAPPADPVCGNAAVEAGEQCDDGNTANGDGCSSSCRTEPRPRPVATVLPGVLQALRLSGETQLHPGAITQNQMVRDGVGRVEGVVKLCITLDGGVGATKLLVSTGYAAYDAILLAAVRDWRYRPYLLDGAPVPACSTVRFVYKLQ